VREVRLVSVSADFSELTVVEDRSGDTFTVPVTVEVRALVAQAAPSGRPAALSIAEIQARLRAGADPVEVACDAGIALARFDSFAAPVLAELAAVADDVRAELARRGQAVDDKATVTAVRASDGRYTVTVATDGSTSVWRWDRATKSLVAAHQPAAAHAWPEQISVGQAHSTPVAEPAHGAQAPAAGAGASPRRGRRRSVPAWDDLPAARHA
jgi:Protein of unknown function (DUF3071)